MSPRDEFAAALAARNALTPDVLRGRLVPVEREYELKLWRMFRAEFPSKSFTVGKAEKHFARAGKLAAVRDEYRAKGQPAIDAFRAEQARWDAELKRLAPLISLGLEDNIDRVERIYSSHHPNEYHTQGGGADTYARVYAELTVFILESVGVTAGVVRATAIPADPARVAGEYPWQVWIRLDPIQIEAVERLEHKIPQRELVRFCWKHGANPRVYWPLLPPGFEESNGLDYFGNDSRA